MSQTHYYYALNRKAAERIVSLTWTQFLKKFGWGPPSQWKDIGGYLAFCLDRPTLPEEPTPEEIAPILRWTIRETIPRMGIQYYCMLELHYQLRRHTFVKLDLNAEGLQTDCDALMICAILAFQDGDIDDRTLWSVLAIHENWSTVSNLFRRHTLALSGSERRQIRTISKQFGRCRPLFDWQTLNAVRDGHSALSEDDTLRFRRFIQLAWRKNLPVEPDALLNFRDFELARELHDAVPALRGNCLVHCYGS